MCKLRHFECTDNFMLKCMELFQIQRITHGVMLVGTVGTGKSTVWRTLLDAMEKLDNVKGDAYVVDPKAVSKEELYGKLDPTTLEPGSVLTLLERMCTILCAFLNIYFVARMRKALHYYSRFLSWTAICLFFSQCCRPRNGRMVSSLIFCDASYQDIVARTSVGSGSCSMVNLVPGNSGRFWSIQGFGKHSLGRFARCG